MILFYQNFKNDANLSWEAGCWEIFPIDLFKAMTAKGITKQILTANLFDFVGYWRFHLGSQSKPRVFQCVINQSLCCSRIARWMFLPLCTDLDEVWGQSEENCTRSRHNIYCVRFRRANDYDWRRLFCKHRFNKPIFSDKFNYRVVLSADEGQCES